jgi:hypothetical protein
MDDPVFIQIPDDCRLKVQWQGEKLHLTWHKDGEAIAGIALTRNPARLTASVLNSAVSEKESRETQTNPINVASLDEHGGDDAPREG